MPNHPIAVVGGGAWGTALAQAAATAGRDVVLWVRDPERAREMQESRRNARYLPGIALHGRIRVTARADELRAASQRALRRARSGDARDGPGAVAPPCRGRPAGHLRQGHRAGLGTFPQRCRRRAQAGGSRRRAVGTELRIRRGARPADGRDAGLHGPGSGVGAGGGAVGAEFPRLPRDRPARRRDRRGGQERARHRLPASSRAAGSARAPRRRSPRAASPSSCVSPAPMAASPRP